MNPHYRPRLALVLFLLASAPVSVAQVSRPGEYSGYSPALYTETVRSSQYVAMRDGVKLAVDLLRPARSGAAVNNPHPVLWIYNWGGRASNGRHAVDSYAALVKYGYVVAFADGRGTGASFGAMVGSYSRTEAQDTYDLTEWLGTQPWSDGKVGMMGCSHSGAIEWHAAGMKPPHLKAIFPQCYSYDYYFGKVQGGIPNIFRAAGTYERDKTSAPMDEDPTGAMRDEAVEQHKNGETDAAVFGVLPFRDSFSPLTKSKAWEEASPVTYFKDIQAAAVPTYQWGSWNDFMTKVMRDVFVFSANIESVRKTTLGPGGHCVFGNFDVQAEARRWFDYWLKGIDNGIMKEPPFYFITMNAEPGKEWRYSWKWPLPNAKDVTYYLAEGPSGSPNHGTNDGSLSAAAPRGTSDADKYPANYSVMQATRDSQGITYTTPALGSDKELVGYVKADIWVSSSATDQDFFGFLEDLDAAGSATVITQLQLRGSHRQLSKPAFNNLGLPWRANLQSEAAPMTPDQPVRLVFDPLPISYIVRAGHRIRFTITNAYPSYTFLQPAGAVVNIYRDAQHASSISLPEVSGPIQVRVTHSTPTPANKEEVAIAITPPAELGKGYRAEDIDTATLQCNGARPIRTEVKNQALVATFRSQDALRSSSAGLKVTGSFRYGIPFVADDTAAVARSVR